MTVLEKIKLQEAYQKVLNESLGDIINAGYSSMTMGSPFAPRPYRPGTNELKSSEELQQEQKNSAIAGAVGLGAGAAVVNPAAAATVGKLGLNGLNAYGNYELIKDLSNDFPTATAAAGNVAILNPQMAANIVQKALNGRWGWITGVGYPVTKAFVQGYNDAVNSQPSANQQTPANTNKQPTTSNDKKPTTSNDKKPPRIPHGVNVKALDDLNYAVGKFDYDGLPIPPAGTNNVVQSIYKALGDENKGWEKTQDFDELYNKLSSFVNQYELNQQLKK